MKRIAYLDGIRGLAIILVFVGHAWDSFPFIQDSKSKIFLGNAHLGVIIFFVLSGYLITTLLLREKEKKGKINLTNFYIRRALRIFPVYYLYLTIVFIGYWLGKLKISLPYIVFSGLYLTNYRHFFLSDDSSSNHHMNVIGHFWTLSLEEQFYLIWPSLLVLGGIVNVKKMLPFILFLYPFIRVISYFLFPQMRGQIGMMLHTMGDSIFWGCYAALIEKFHPSIVERIVEILNKRRILIWSLLILVFLIFPVLGIIFKGAFNISIRFSLEGVFLSILLLYIINGKHTYFNFLNNSLLSYVGVLSYSIYVWHILFLRTDTILSTFPYNVIITIIAALISYNLIEKPIMKLKDKFI
jgi:peptidoglycan/LPS O-acetylase OafA/YrhL